MRPCYGPVRRKGRPPSRVNPAFSAAQLAAGRTAWEAGQSVGLVKQILGAHNDNLVYVTARREGWAQRTPAQRAALRRVSRAANGVPATAPSTPAPGTTPRRRCWSCLGITTTDPCEHCAARWEVV